MQIQTILNMYLQKIYLPLHNGKNHIFSRFVIQYSTLSLLESSKYKAYIMDP